MRLIRYHFLMGVEGIVVDVIELPDRDLEDEFRLATLQAINQYKHIFFKYKTIEFSSREVL